MAKPRIKLALWNDEGAVASIEDNMEDVDIVLHKTNRDPKVICLKAAKRLRKLADDFERLANMENPFKEETQKKASTDWKRL